MWSGIVLMYSPSYDDNDASKGAAPAPPAADAPAPVDEAKHDVGNQHGASDDQPAGGAEAMQQDQNDDEEDDDDDVDFNLGGGSTSFGNNSSAKEEPSREAPTPPAYGAVHKASAKEDG